MAEAEKRTLPQSDLDLQLMTTDCMWGKSGVSKELKDRLKKIKYKEVTYKDEKTGKTKKGFTPEEDSLWGLLGFYTRDMRLANLSASSWNNEVEYVDYHLNLANDLLQEGMIESFIIALSRVATKLELSQSKNGFLRKQMNTFRKETTHTEKEPPKKSLFGSEKRRNN